MSRWVVTGWGRAGRVHTAALAQVPGAEVVGVVEASAQVREQAEATGLATFADLQTAITATSPDAVSVAVPHDGHAEAVQVAAANGLPVVVEKPIGRDPAEVAAMIRCAEEAGVQLGGIMNYRSYRQLQWVREVIADGRFVVEDALMHADLPRPAGGSGWEVDGARSGGGFMLTVGVHYLDLLAWWLGEPSAVVALAEPAGADTRASGLLTFPGGAHATVVVNAVAPTTTGTRFVLVGPQGRIVVEGSTVVSAPQDLQPPEPETQGTDLTYGAGHLAYLHAADAAVAAGEPFPVTAAEAAVSVRLVDAWYESARTRRWVALEGAAGGGRTSP